MMYFKDVNTLEELRRQYKELLKKYHSDNINGSTEACQNINAEYDILFKVLKDKHENKTAKTADSTAHKESSYNTNIYDWENDKVLREVLQKIINFDGIEIELVGAWLWVSGNTYAYKKELNDAHDRIWKLAALQHAVGAILTADFISIEYNYNGCTLDN